MVKLLRLAGRRIADLATLQAEAKPGSRPPMSANEGRLRLPPCLTRPAFTGLRLRAQRLFLSISKKQHSQRN